MGCKVVKLKNDAITKRASNVYQKNGGDDSDRDGDGNEKKTIQE